ncbi:reverse transcriptase domain-containing protein [Tanacetum coccineum]
MIGFSGETYPPLGIIDLRVTMGKDRRSKTVLMEFAIIKCCSLYNIIIGKTGMRSLRAVGSTIHSMIKFPTNQGVVIMETSREALRECKHLERVQGPASPEKTWGREDAEEVFTIGHEHPDQHVTMGTTLTTNYKQLLADILRKNIEVDYSSLNKACAKDIYPFPEEEEELTSLMGYPYKCFLQLSKEYSQIRITEDDEEKTGFYTEEGEVEGSVVKKFFGKEEQVERTPDANKGGTLTLSKKIQAKSTPAPRVWRLYLGKETIEEGSGVGIILVGPEETMLSYVIRLKFNASNHVMDCKALLAGLAASANQGMKDLHVFIDSLTLVAQVPNHTPPKNPEPKSKSVNRVCNYKDRIPQPGSIEMDFMSFMLGGVDGELNFLLAEVASEGRNSPSAKSVNNAPIIGATPLSSVYPSNVVENVVDSDDPSYGEDEQNLIEFPSAKELKDATDCHWVVAHVTPRSWKQHLKEISIEQLYDIHDRAYMRQVVLDNLEKDRAYAELERKCNEALQDLDKNPLVSDIRTEIKDLQG